MNTVIRKIGNSEGVILPKELLARFELKEGDRLSIVAGADGLRLIPAKDAFARQLEAAREGMEKYKVALRELAK